MASYEHIHPLFSPPTFAMASSSSTSSSSPSSTPSPFSPISPSSFPPLKPLDDVWHDISLSSLHPHHHNPTSHLRFLDFLRPFPPHPHPPPPPRPPVLPSSAPPPTALRLSAAPEFQFLDMNADPAVVGPPGGAFEALALAAFGKKKRGAGEQEDKQEESCNGGDRKHKRMIKNRESAARSRARRQAYITELEHEVNHLMEENARLRKQHHQIFQAQPAQLPKKHGLQRTLTAPF